VSLWLCSYVENWELGKHGSCYFAKWIRFGQEQEELQLAMSSSFLPWMTRKTSACCAAARDPPYASPRSCRSRLVSPTPPPARPRQIGAYLYTFSLYTLTCAYFILNCAETSFVMQLMGKYKKHIMLIDLILWVRRYTHLFAFCS
jgi:hypothetical protein